MTGTNSHANIVIVGGGPIGCWTALQIKKRDPQANIVIYERRPVYQRNHILSIGKESFFQWSKNDDANVPFLNAVFNAQSTCSIAWGLNAGGLKPAIDLGTLPHNRLFYWLNLPKVLDIRAVDFESILKDECEKAEIDFIYKGINSPDEAMDLHRECTKFIDATGANSKIRETLLGKVIPRDIFPSLDFNYVSHGQARYLRVNTYDKLGHVYAENIGLEENGTSSVNIRMIVSKGEYDALPKATFKEPLILTPDSPEWEALGPSKIYGRTLKQDFYDLRALRHLHANENPVDGPVSMTKVYLSKYRAKKFATEVEHGGKTRSWFLVGDSPMGMPFYRSVNSGIIMGSQLAYLLTTPLVPDSQKTNVYNYYTRPCRLAREWVRTTKTELRIMAYKNVFRPVLHHIARTPAAPLVQVPLDYALKTLKFGKTS
jgi:hypothetical protein